MERLAFLTPEQVLAIREAFGSPVFVYDEKTLLRRASEVLAFPNAFGFTARYAMKACPTRAIVQILHRAGLFIDASSGYEAQRAMLAGVPPQHIQITAQEIPKNLAELLGKGVLFNATSLHQLEIYGELCPGTEAGVRINPGLGSGHNNRTNVGGPTASFGIWHEYLERVLAVAEKWKLRVTRMHTHIGSGADPQVWNRCAKLSLHIAERLPDVKVLSLGGGFKVGRMSGEPTANLQEIGMVIKRDVEQFAEKTGRRLHLEIEPGTYLVANAGALVCSIIDVVDTGKNGYVFLKTDTGMTEVTRPTLYGAQHPLVVVPANQGSRGRKNYIVVGHCCESGDVLTPAPGNPEGLAPRELLEAAIGDALVIEAVGAYCSGMCTKNYNSFPEAAEVLLRSNGDTVLIRKRQTLEQIVSNEIGLNL
ncbi:MAG TPA: diaminopimelate decarboxylase [Candidatus Hydrogenedentes bacterium]|nr:diaminopimelate decarboxylase [Candidatus Hydrogenedentota bacterium]HOL75913.1 diaminopimelate decarboxylase [Candidatus Hydrogenedentota bacterium]HPO85678.1 diaminopimelate decarboxylase [Candidatus Hydrogenedentota bacterium]